MTKTQQVVITAMVGAADAAHHSMLSVVENALTALRASDFTNAPVMEDTLEKLSRMASAIHWHIAMLKGETYGIQTEEPALYRLVRDDAMCVISDKYGENVFHEWSHEKLESAIRYIGRTWENLSWHETGMDSLDFWEYKAVEPESGRGWYKLTFSDDSTFEVDAENRTDALNYGNRKAFEQGVTLLDLEYLIET